MLAVAGCARDVGDTAGRLEAEDAVLGAALGDTTRLLVPTAMAGDTLWLAAELDAPLSRAGQVDSTAWTAFWRRALADLPSALTADYLAAQRRERRLARVPAVTGRTVVFSPRLEPAPPSAPRWVAVASRVGFTPGRDSAVVHVSHGCGPICGRETAVLLVRRAGRWQVARTLVSAVR